MNEWLNNFAYKIKIEIWIFIITFFASLVITFFTVGFHSVKAAKANPIDSLRYE
jgi:putative ABC transport system permease protein